MLGNCIVIGPPGTQECLQLPVEYTVSGKNRFVSAQWNGRLDILLHRVEVIPNYYIPKQ